MECVEFWFVFILSLGRKLDGIHFAVSFLETWQKKQAGNDMDYLKLYAKDKDIVIVGGGDTGCDCIATSLRQVYLLVFSGKTIKSRYLLAQLIDKNAGVRRKRFCE